MSSTYLYGEEDHRWQSWAMGYMARETLSSMHQPLLHGHAVLGAWCLHYSPLSVPNIHCHHAASVPHGIKMADIVTACIASDTSGWHTLVCSGNDATDTCSLSPHHTLTAHSTHRLTHPSNPLP